MRVMGGMGGDEAELQGQVRSQAELGNEERIMGGKNTLKREQRTYTDDFRIEVYLAAPYSHQNPGVRARRLERINRYTAKLIRGGVTVFSLITYTGALAEKDGLPGDWAFWKGLDEAFLRMCRVVYVLGLPGWKQSVGVAAEIALARELGMPVFLVDAGSGGVVPIAD